MNAVDERTARAEQSSGEGENYGVYTFTVVDGQIVANIYVGVGDVSEADAQAAANELARNATWATNVRVALVHELVVPDVPVSTQDTAGDE